MFEKFQKYLTCQNIINFILIVIIIILLVNIMRQKFFGKSNGESLTDGVKERLKNGKLVVYKTNSCGYCVKLMKLLNDLDLINHVRVVDVGTQSGKTEYAALGEKGVPIIKSEATGEVNVGYIDNMNDLALKLKLT